MIHKVTPLGDKELQAATKQAQDELLRSGVANPGPMKQKGFRFKNAFVVVVPKKFNLNNCPRERFGLWSEIFTDTNYPAGLVCGERYVAEIYQLTRERLTTQEMIEVALEKNRCFGNVRAGALCGIEYQEYLPFNPGNWILCPDEKKNLFDDPSVMDSPTTDGRIGLRNWMQFEARARLATKI